MPRPVVVGIVLGLGMGFMLEGAKMMAAHWPIAAVALAGTLLLLTNRRVPAMLLLLVFGAGFGMLQSPELLSGLIPVIASALAADANIFVTGDKALQDLGKVDNMVITSPRQLFERLIAKG